MDFEKGILQAIGYKEFYDYYKYMRSKYPTVAAPESTSIEPKDSQDHEHLTDAKLRLKNKTMQYTVSQIKWLSKRMSNLFLNTDHLLAIDLDDPKLYEQLAFNTSLDFIEKHLHLYASLSSDALDDLKTTLCNDYAASKALKM